MELPTEPKRGRGRPAGSKNKKPEPHREVPPSPGKAFDAYRGDPQTTVARMFTMLDFAQQQVQNRMLMILEDKHAELWVNDVLMLEKLSSTLVRSLSALEKSADLAEEMAKRMTPEQLLDAALKKIEGQDLNTLNAAIKRLRTYRARLAPMGSIDMINSGDKIEAPTATSAIQSLEAEAE